MLEYHPISNTLVHLERVGFRRILWLRYTNTRPTAFNSIGGIIMIKAIICVDKQGAIGQNGDMP